MFLRRFTDFVLQNRVQGMAVAFVIGFIPVVSSIGVLIAALVTLRKGAVEGFLVLIAATLASLITFYTSPAPSDQALIVTGVLGIIVASNLLTWFFAFLLKRFGNWSFILELAALLGVLAVIIVHLVFPEIQEWWAKQLTAYFAKTATLVNKVKSNETMGIVPNEVQLQAVSVAKYFATGFITASILVNALIQLLFARWWQAVIFNPGGLRSELYKIRFSFLSGFVFITGFILAYLRIDFALDAMPVMYVIFFIAGLSLIHSLLSLTKNNWLWLIVVYSFIIWLFPLSLLAVAFIALIDIGLDFRKRFLLER